MIKSLNENKDKWSRWEEDDNGILIKTADRRITELVGDKLEILAQVCSARIIDIVK